ncbi:3-oxoacyl-ACP reductase FabG [Emcibacter sp. SYSU 3D8]|uniref:3-oxoacyl-ACP reductase FabG n=1 Tax=Emcibacter sp. SYSU 3D8 TaxID=3133969 RepID=UPI0031FE5178
MSNDPSTRPVLVTGASKGIGRAIAARLAGDGFPVTVHYNRDLAGAEETCGAIATQGGRARLLRFDISDRAETTSAIESDVAENGAYWGLVLNAGIARDGAFPALRPEHWDDVMRTNLDGFFNVTQPLVMPMIRRRDGGRIVTLSSVSGLMGNRGQVNYSAAKAGIIGATKALAVELAKRSITVNCVAPGLIETDMTGELPAQVLDMIPMRRMGHPDEVAGLVGFLLSAQSAYITRQVISVNGGMY